MVTPTRELQLTWRNSNAVEFQILTFLSLLVLSCGVEKSSGKLSNEATSDQITVEILAEKPNDLEDPKPHEIPFGVHGLAPDGVGGYFVSDTYARPSHLDL